MEQTMDSLLQPDTFLPAQYFETIRRENHLDPEKMLMLAVLEDGVICFQKYIFTRDEKEKRLLSEAEECTPAHKRHTNTQQTRTHTHTN